MQRRVYFRPPADWSQLTEAERRAFAEAVAARIIAAASNEALRKPENEDAEDQRD
jgi:hypothetical protein